MTQSYLDDLIGLAARIDELDKLEGQLDKRDWKAAKAEYEAQQEQFNKVRDSYIDGLLDGEGRTGSVVEDVEAQLLAIRNSADTSWHRAIDYTSDNLLPRLRKEAHKSPKTRRAIKAAPYVGGILAVAIYFGIALFSATPVSDPIETKAGLQQRAAAAKKAIRYDDFMGTRVRKGGWLKGILFWPIEPSESETQGAAEFFGLVLEGQQYAEGCGSIANDGQSLSDGQIGMVSEVADYVLHSNTKWREPPIRTVVDGLQEAEAC